MRIYFMGMLMLHHQKTCQKLRWIVVVLALIQDYKDEVNQVLIALRF